MRLNPAPPASADFSSRPQVTVPDGGPEGKAGITDTLTATGCVAIDAVSVYVDITHGDPMDLEMHLTSPNGTTIRLSTGSGPTRDDRIGWFPQQIEPSESLNVFEDEYGNGEWILRVIDDNSDYNDTAGTWNEWGLALTCK